MIRDRVRSTVCAVFLSVAGLASFSGCSGDDTGVEGSIKIGKDRDAVRNQILGGGAGETPGGKADPKVATPGGKSEAPK
jgi:hypothetical protein